MNFIINPYTFPRQTKFISQSRLNFNIFRPVHVHEITLKICKMQIRSAFYNSCTCTNTENKKRLVFPPFA